MDKHNATPALVAGRLCALVNPRDGSVRIVFDGTAAHQDLEYDARGTGHGALADGVALVSHLLEPIGSACERLVESPAHVVSRLLPVTLSVTAAG